MKKWILPIIIALLLTTQTIAGGVFFFTIVWLMQLDPRPYSKTLLAPGKANKKSAKWIYNWLLLSPLITLPIFLIMVAIFYDSSSTGKLVLAALIPSSFHAILLFGLGSKSHFVFRHTQQAIFLVALRAGMAALAVNIGSYPEDGLGLFIIGNGSLWLFSTIWGRNQIFRGKCWWMERKGEIIVTKVKGDTESGMADLTSELNPTQDLSPREHIHLSDLSLLNQNKSQAKEHALAAFRFGDEETKKQAVEILDELSEVEMF